LLILIYSKEKVELKEREERGIWVSISNVHSLWMRVWDEPDKVRGVTIEEGRAASKSPHLTFGYFLSTSRQEVSADIIQNSVVGNFSPKTEGTKTIATTCLFFLMSFPFLYILNSLNLLLLLTFCHVCLPVKETAEIETGMTEKSSWDQANIQQKLVWL
jgi:hypothetical protein